MLIHQVTTHEIGITRRGSINHFQLRLPRHAEKVIGIECGVQMITPLPWNLAYGDFITSFHFLPSLAIGELRLQHVGKAGIFFSTQIMEQDSNLGFADFSALPGFKPKSWTHQSTKEPISVEVNREANVLLGVYRDIVGTYFNMHMEYKILIHLWFETKEGIS